MPTKPSPPSNPNNTPADTSFRSYPQKYPKAQARASEAVSHIFRMIQKGPQSLSAIVVDTAFHYTQGYVLCQLQFGLAHVYGVPYGSLVSGMRIFCRQIGAAATNRSYIFDGYAPNVSTLKLTGSVLMADRFDPAFLRTACATTPHGVLGGMPSISQLPSSVGYYWHLFFYLPDLPTTTVTLFQQSQVSGSNELRLEYLPTGMLQFRSDDYHGYITTRIVPPHQVHYVQIQPGLVGQEMVVDGVVNYKSRIGTNDKPTYIAGGQVYTGSCLSNFDGTQVCSLGTWVSKVGYGTNYAGGAPVALPAPVPTSDAQIPLLNAGVGRTSFNTYLCLEAPGAFTLNNSAGGVGAPLILIYPYNSLIATGPY